MLETEYAYNVHLKELHASEFEMADGEPDIRNWKVIGLQNQEVGKVSELLFDELSRRVRYLIIQINGKPLNLISRSVLIPVGMAELLSDEKVVLIPGLTINHLATLPAYEKGRVSRKTEYIVRNVFSPVNEVVERRDNLNQKDAFYDHEHFNDDRHHEQDGTCAGAYKCTATNAGPWRFYEHQFFFTTNSRWYCRCYWRHDRGTKNKDQPAGAL